MRAEAGQLAVRAPEGEITPELQAQLAARKSEILAHLRAASADEAQRARAPELRKREREQPVVQSFAQQRLWYLDQLEPFSSLYNMTPTFRLRGAVDATSLQRALDEILRRHDVLRTRLSMEQGLPTQAVDPHGTLRLKRVDMRRFSETEREGELRRMLVEDAGEPFDLANDLLIRAALYDLGDNDHVFALVVHHAVFDGWSLGVFLRELSTLYSAYQNGETPQLEELPVQYADFSVWQRESFERGELERQKHYWTDRLGGQLPTLGLPTDRPRPRVQSYRGGRLDWRTPPEVAEGLRRFARHQRATAYMVLLAAFKSTLFRYTGEPDVIVGAPVACRTTPSCDGLIGLFANTLVFRTDLEGNPSFAEAVDRVRETCLGAFSHQDMPFERLVEEIQPDRDTSRTPVFQAMFSMEEEGNRSAKLGEIALEPIDVDHAVARTDLCMWLRPAADGQGFEGHLEYCRDLFDRATMQRFLRHFDSLLGAGLDAPGEPIEQLPMLDDSERERVLVDWNNTDEEYDRGQTICGLIESTVRETPGRSAVSYGGKQLTYAQLDARANQLASSLRSLGVGTDSLVGIHLERSELMVIAVLGILKAGAAFLPLDPHYPRARLELMVGDSGTRVVVSESSLAGDHPPLSDELVLLDQAFGDNLPDRPPVAADEVSPDDLAYVIYTSGSTGTPKGVAVEHRAAVNFLDSMARRPGIGADDRVLAITTLSFDISVLELLLPLTVGAHVVIADPLRTSDVRQLIAQIEAEDITFMQATPTTWRMLLEAGWEGSSKLKVLCGGEEFPLDLADELVDRVGSVWNMYGPTETTIWSACHRLAETRGSVPIGRPIGNTRIYVLDRHQAPVPVGVPGELWIGGAGLARGYLGRPDKTAEAFVDVDPGNGTQRLYRTGDLGRFREDGTIEYLGRIDSQIKLRGFRIELGEIEASIARHPEVRQAVVALQEVRPGDERLFAYLVAEQGASLSAKEIKEHVRSTLPEYMVPQHVVSIDAVPLTQNGKVDRRALPSLGAFGGATLRDGFEAPSTDAEKLLAKIWADALDVERIGVSDNFFDLGGHSLLAMRVIYQLEESSGHRLTPMQLALQTLGQLASLCEGAPDAAPRGASLSRRVVKAVRSAVTGT